METTRKQLNFIERVNRRFLMLAALLIMLIVVTQFGVLATLGTKGAEITAIRQEKDQLREEIEDLRASIDKARTLSNIEAGLNDTLHLEVKYVETLVAPETDVTASLIQ